MDRHEFRRAIAAKRDGETLPAATWKALVEAYLASVVDDAPMAALLMACVLRGLDYAEAAALTEAFVESGERLAFADPRTIDKHSSGGVADTASLIVVPLVAACGVPVAKLSGRALGHTGGTLDKLEAVPGVRVDLTPAEFAAAVREVGCAIAAQSERLVPADKRIYALRDRTGTVPSLGLIAASIVSKKIAGGAHGIVFDVKAGRGAFMSSVPQARELARTLVAIARSFGRRALALVTDMNEPLGPAIGTGLETIEARDFLSGARRDPRLESVVTALGAAMLAVSQGSEGARPDAPGETARTRLTRALEGGAAYERFERMLAAQGAAAGALAALRPHAERRDLGSPRDGRVSGIDPVALGEAARDLVERSGPFAGIVVRRRLGERVAADDALATVFGDPGPDLEARIRAAFELDGRLDLADSPVYDEIGSREALETGTLE